MNNLIASGKRYSVILADCLKAMADMEENSIDAVICDPPYALGFMGKAWDRFPTDKGPKKPFANRSRESKLGGSPFQEWCRVWATEALRVAKPGAYLMAFGGTRTFHRLAVAIEDAGWILKDTMMWVYGSGFPKSHDVSKALDRKAGAEREVVGENPNCRDSQADYHWAGGDTPTRQIISKDITAPATSEAKQWDGFGTALKPAWEPIILAQKPIEGALLSEIHAITGWRRWHTIDPKKAWTGKAEDEKSWKQSQCYKRCKKYGLEWWEKEVDEGKVERWIFERCWLALEPKTQGRHVVIGKNKRLVLGRTKYKDRVIINTAANIIKWGCGALNIDACRIGASGGMKKENIKAGSGGFQGKDFGCDGDIVPTDKGRWPANVLLSHTVFCARVGEKRVKAIACGSPYNWHGKKEDKGKMHAYGDPDGLETVEDWRCVPDCPVAILDGQSGESKGAAGPKWQKRKRKGFMLSGSEDNIRAANSPDQYGDQGGASRFFYCAKASRSERNAGLEERYGLFEKRQGFEEKIAGGMQGRQNGSLKGSIVRAQNNHPTVKPIALLRYLCRLVTPPNGIILDPFAGSGSTGCAAVLEGLRIIGIEKEREYVEIARARIAHFSQGSP